MNPVHAFATKLGRHWQRILVTLLPLVFVLLHATGALSPLFLQRVDEFVYDVRLRLTMPRTLAEKVVIVDIDEKSLAAVGQWPWPRDKMAALVDSMFQQHGATIVGIDMVFAEPDTSSGLLALERLAQGPLGQQAEFVQQVAELRPSLDHDAQFARTLARHPVALGYYFSSDRNGQQHGQLPAPVMRKDDLHGRRLRATSWNGYGANLPIFAQAAPAAGFFNSVTSSDGVVRAVPLLAEFEQQYYASFPLAMLRLLTGEPRVAPVFPSERFLGKNYSKLESLQLQYGQNKNLRLPVDENIAIFVPYRGPGGPSGGSFHYYSAVDVLQGQLAPNALRDKLVLLGTTAPGLLDLRVAPVGAAYPGVEVHANVLSGFLEGTIPVRPDYAMGYEVLHLLIVGLLLGLALPLLSAPRALLLSAVVLLASVALNTWAYLSWYLVLPLASIVLLIVTALAFNMSYGYFFESRSKRALARLFGNYVPPELVNEMVKDPSRYSMAAQNKDLTVMFCDMRGFSQMAERMDPLALQALLTQVLGKLTDVIRANHGTIDKYMGDCIMAFWGAPVDAPEHAKQALRAAHEMLDALAAINQAQGHKNAVPIGVGIAINSGVMCVGDMGSPSRQAYTVIGDEVNLCARLESLSRVFAVPIIVGESTRTRNADYAWQELDWVQVKNRKAPSRIFTPLGLRSAQSADKLRELKIWDAALREYRAGNWDECEMYLLNAMRLNPNSHLYRLYSARINTMRLAPPQNWTGVTVLDSPI